ncbi:hypothetical protein [Streptomyces sp. NPDC046821]|uniref:hypothetical protein n=1 Tax=Streptomyces sp. NPDC046821 TaxID=3154702 RepID=UPI0033DABC3B
MTDTTPVRDSNAEPTEQELRDLAAKHDIDIPTRPPLGLVRRSRFDDLADDLVTALVALAKAKDDVRYWMGRFDEAHDRATVSRLSETAARTAYDVANERANKAEGRLKQIKEQREHHLTDDSHNVALLAQVQQAGRDIVAAYAKGADESRVLDEIGRVLVRHAHRFDVPPSDLVTVRRRIEETAQLRDRPAPSAYLDDEGGRQEPDAEERTAEQQTAPAPGPTLGMTDAELLAASYRYEHESTAPALIADHLPVCAWCTQAVSGLPTDTLIEASRIARDTKKSDALYVLLLEFEQRGLLGTHSTTATEATT